MIWTNHNFCKNLNCIVGSFDFVTDIKILSNESSSKSKASLVVVCKLTYVSLGRDPRTKTDSTRAERFGRGPVQEKLRNLGSKRPYFLNKCLVENRITTTKNFPISDRTEPGRTQFWKSRTGRSQDLTVRGSLPPGISCKTNIFAKHLLLFCLNRRIKRKMSSLYFWFISAPLTNHLLILKLCL